MIVNEWIEPYTLVMGIHSMGVITEVLCISGLVYAPFFIVILKSIVEAMTQGEDEGNAGELAVKFLRKELLIIFPVFIMAFVPMSNSNMSFSVTSKSYACDDESRKKDPPSAKQQSMMGNFTGGYTSIPAWWLIVHDYASTMTNSIIASMPCAADLNMATANLQSANLENSYDQVIAKQWQQSCLAPAIGNANKTGTMSDEVWPGADELRDFYRMEQNTVLISRESAQAAGLPISEMDGAEVRVNCDTAYQHIEQAAVTSAKNQADSSFSLINFLSNDSDYAKKMAMEKVAKVSTKYDAFMDAEDVSQNKVEQNDSWGYNTFISIGVAIGNIFKAPGAVVMKNTTPILVCVIQMTLLMVIPILVVFSGFNMKTVLALSATYFGLEFTLVLVNLATWIDNTLGLFFFSDLTALFNHGENKENISLLQSSIMTSVGYVSYDLLPKIWMGLLAYVGIKGGAAMTSGASAIEQSVNSGASKATSLTKTSIKASIDIGKVVMGKKAGRAKS